MNKIFKKKKKKHYIDKFVGSHDENLYEYSIIFL